MESQTSIRIQKIELVNSSITAPGESGQISRFAFELQFRAVVELKEKLVIIFSDAFIKDPGQNTQLGRYSASFHFHVADLDQHLEKNRSEISQPLLTILLGISVSSLRGMMFEAFRGTFLHHAILPIADLTAIQPTQVAIPN